MPFPGSPVGRAFGPYQVLRELGTGGMGRVYLARSPGGREVAVKVLHAELANGRGYRECFAAEAAAARAVAGIFTASVIDADAFAPEPWLATEYVAGPSLERAVKDTGILDERRLRELAAGLAEALLAIHAVGIVHRDLKPSNVLMSVDGPRVIDFGISAALRSDSGEAGQSAPGSAGYAPPEQVAGHAAPDRAGDVFSLGAVLVFAATGRGPFGDGAHAALLYRVVHEQPDLSGVSTAVREVVAACLRKDPAARPTPAEVLAATAPAYWQPGPTAPGAPGVLGVPQAQGPAAAFVPPTVDLAARTVPYQYPIVRPLAPPSPPTLSAPGSVPTGIAPEPRRGLTRRNLLMIGTLGAAGAAGLTALGIALADRTPAQSAAAGPTPEPPGTTPAARGTSAFGSESLPQAPSPEWTVGPASPPKNGQLATLDGTVFWFPLATMDGEDLLAFDTATGSQLWIGSQKAPVRGTQGQFEWSGLYGDAFYGYSTGYDGSFPYCTIFGLDAQGNPIVNTAIASGSYALVMHMFWVSDGVAFVWLVDGSAPSAQALTAVSLASGEILWSTPIDIGLSSAVTADSTRCYVYQGSSVSAIDLNSGDVLWQTTAPSHTYYDLRLVGDTLIATGGLDASLTKLMDGFLALDAATGTQLWSTANAYPFSTFGSTVYGLGIAAPDLTAYDARTGTQIWQFESPVLTNDSSMLDVYSVAGTLASANLVAIPFEDGSYTYSGTSTTPSMTSATGVLVLDSATGKARWAYSGPPSSSTSSPSSFLVAVSDNAVYAASPTTLYAFNAGG